MLALPLISVIMPVYNGERFLKEALYSIINQTLKDFELIIINDGSSDASHEIIAACKDSRIKYIQRENKGLAKTLNEGLELAQGQYIARMDADDIADPTRFEKQVTFLNAHPNCILTCTNMRVIDERGRVVRPKLFFGDRYTPPLQWSLLWENPIAHPTVMMRLDVLKAHSLHYPDVLAEDYALWLELAFYGQMHRLDEPLLSYRVHGSSIMHTKITRVAACAVDLAKKYGKRLGLDQLDDFLGYSSSGPFLKDKTLPSYRDFSQFIVQSIEACHQIWPMNDAEKRRCRQYGDFLYFTTVLRLKNIKGVLYSLLMRGHYPMWMLLMQRIRDKIIRCFLGRTV